MNLHRQGVFVLWPFSFICYLIPISFVPYPGYVPVPLGLPHDLKTLFCTSHLIFLFLYPFVEAGTLASVLFWI